MSKSNLQRDFALQVVRQLREAGYEALWAGGCVRDQLLDHTPKDYDIATSARPEQVRELFGRRRTLAIGAAFGVIAVQSRGYEPIEVATFRSDGAYLDGRHPVEVTFATAEEDAQRRDFTINGMFFDPLAEEVIDYVEGQRDLAQGIIRAIGDPQARFAEDKLRMLRAVRFAATFGFQIEPITFAAIQAMANEIHIVSAERIGSELHRILVHPQRALGIQLLRETNLLAEIMPAVAAHFADDCSHLQHSLEFLDRLETDSLPVAFATLLWNSSNAEQLKKLGRSFRFSNKEIDRAAWLIENLACVVEAERLPWPQLQRKLVHAGGEELMALAVAVLGDDHPGVILCQERLQLPAVQLNPPLLITGDDLVEHGLQPGRHFAELLYAVRDAQLEGQIANREEALKMVDAWVRERGEG